MKNSTRKPWKTQCRCGEPLLFSCEDIATGRPAMGADYWCSNPDPARGPHDWGVVTENGLEGAKA